MEKCYLCKLHAVLVYYQYNLRLLHWKIGGSGFEEGHSLMDTYIEKFSSFIDKVGEIMLCTHKEHHIESLEGIISLLEDDKNPFVRIDPSSMYDLEQVFKYTDSMFRQILDITKEARWQLDHDCEDDLASELDSIIYWFRIETLYKLKHKLMK